MTDPKFSSFLIAIVFSMISFGCSVDPRPIEFGVDQCYSCKMMIADGRFGGELVTNKGKVFKFDAAECMIDHLRETGEEGFKYVLAIDYSNPETLIDARKAYFLVSPYIPSPMGANLSVYSSKETLSQLPDSIQAVLLNWEEIKNKLKR